MASINVSKNSEMSGEIFSNFFKLEKMKCRSRLSCRAPSVSPDRQRHPWIPYFKDRERATGSREPYKWWKSPYSLHCCIAAVCTRCRWIESSLVPGRHIWISHANPNSRSFAQRLPLGMALLDLLLFDYFTDSDPWELTLSHARNYRESCDARRWFNFELWFDEQRN